MFAVAAPTKLRLSTVTDERTSRVAPALTASTLAAWVLPAWFRRKVPAFTVVGPA